MRWCAISLLVGGLRRLRARQMKHAVARAEQGTSAKVVRPGSKPSAQPASSDSAADITCRLRVVPNGRFFWILQRGAIVPDATQATALPARECARAAAKGPNPNIEARSPKQARNTNDRRLETIASFRAFEFWYSDLFRASCFVLRIGLLESSSGCSSPQIQRAADRHQR